MTWINFLHIYQPANADAHVIKEATELSYYRICRALEEHPDIKFTVNISGCLWLRWEELGYHDLIGRFAQLVKAGRIDLTGTAAYHPILPLVPAREAKTQIAEHEDILRKFIGAEYKPRGFFLPEMAYSPEAAGLVKAAGYEWLILDEIACEGTVGRADISRVYEDRQSGLAVVLRSRSLSNSYVPETIRRLLDKEQPAAGAVAVTASDGELYGLRHHDPTAEFERLLKRPELRTMTVSEFVTAHPDRQAIAPPAHSWDTSEKELADKEPFNLWQEKNNLVQKNLWNLARLAYNTIEEYKNDSNYHWARWHLVRGLASCTFWWASARDFRFFGAISWSPDMIERGSNELIRSIRALENENTRAVKMKAEKMYIEIKKMIWERHWTYHWKRNIGKQVF